MTKKDVLNKLTLSALAYENVQPIRPGETVYKIDDAATGVQCFIRPGGGQLIITFRGTDSARDWHTDFMIWKKEIPYGNHSSKIRVHAGFISAYKSPAVRDRIHRFITPQVERVVVCGHSYGAALSVLCAVDLQYHFPALDYEVFLFGCPRVGNRAFAVSYDRRVFKTLRVENGNDIVTKLPPVLWGYRHVGIPVPVGARRIPGFFSIRAHTLQNYYSSLFCDLLPT